MKTILFALMLLAASVDNCAGEDQQDSIDASSTPEETAHVETKEVTLAPDTDQTPDPSLGAYTPHPAPVKPDPLPEIPAPQVQAAPALVPPESPTPKVTPPKDTDTMKYMMCKKAVPTGIYPCGQPRSFLLDVSPDIDKGKIRMQLSRKGRRLFHCCAEAFSHPAKNPYDVTIEISAGIRNPASGRIHVNSSRAIESGHGPAKPTAKQKQILRDCSKRELEKIKLELEETDQPVKLKLNLRYRTRDSGLNRPC